MEVAWEFPNKSSAFCLEVAAERARQRGYGFDIDCSDIADALCDTKPKGKNE